MAIFITGDTHGDFTRFTSKNLTRKVSMTKDDFMIICGDFGGVWADTPEQKHQLDWLDQRPFTTLFITGNHENYDLLATYPVETWHGGQIQRIRPSVLHLMRGQMFDLMGKRFFTMGGAKCHDIPDGILEPDDPLFETKYKRLTRRNAFFRVNHYSWWKEELPNDAEYRTARQTLDDNGWKADCIITHCAPTSIQKLVGNYTYTPDALTDFLEEVSQRCAFDRWFFGHYHNNLVIKDKYILLYEQVIQLAF